MRNFIKQFMNAPIKTRGIILIVCGVFFCILSILFTDGWDARDSFIINLQDAYIFEINIGKVWVTIPPDNYYPRGREGHWEPKYSYRIPLKIFIALGLIPVALGIVLLLTGKTDKQKKITESESL
ncbi:MAG: hypothetical protein Q8O92_12100 [Candidatus Latescibacter sp.]|nr:hypothetical protein [Candidatus Latescibacter sp.]